MGLLTGGPDFEYEGSDSDKKLMLMVMTVLSAIIIVLATMYHYDKPKPPACDGRCKYECYERCAKLKDGCPHRYDYGGKDDR